MAIPSLPVSPVLAVTVSDLRSLRELAESGQLKTWQAGAILDVVVNRREGGLLVLTSNQGPIRLPVPADRPFPPGTALQLQVLALAPLQVQLRPAALTAEAALASSVGKLPVPSTGQTGPAPASTGAAVSGQPAVNPSSLPPASLTSPVLASTTGSTLHTTSDPALALREQLHALLSQPQMSSAAVRQQILPQQLQQWLTRLTDWQQQVGTAAAIAPGQTNDGDPDDSNTALALTRQLLQSLPRSAQAAEPEALANLLRQALFGQAPGPAAASGSPSATDWLGTLLRLLQASVPPAPMETAKLPGQTGSSGNPANANATGSGRPAAETMPASISPPLPADEVVEELASLLGRQQQNWLTNVQQDLRMQPLYAELLLRQQERLDQVEISIRADRDGDTETAERAPHHVVRLRFDLPGLGVCQFLIDLHSDDLQLHFYSERGDAAAAFDQHLDWLAAQLAADGLQLSAAHSHTVAQLPSLQPTPARGLHVQV